MEVGEECLGTSNVLGVWEWDTEVPTSGDGTQKHSHFLYIPTMMMYIPTMEL
jgi:hypothetical protein